MEIQIRTIPTAMCPEMTIVLVQQELFNDKFVSLGWLEEKKLWVLLWKHLDDPDELFNN